MDTIFALATAFGKAGVAIVRISGPNAVQAAQKMCGPLPAFRYAGLRKVMDDDGKILDEALVLSFPEKQSFTGEEIVELQLHGSNAVVAAVLRVLSSQDGLRMAQAGEFTRRALENGQLDLAQVEGLADLINAETEAQRAQAHRVLSGELGNKAEAWRVDLIRAAALLEATIDFADEDVPVDVSPEVAALLDRVMVSLRAEVQGVAVAERVRFGFEVAIVGAPNVGKSTLLNALAGRDAAITSEIAGTTRDVIEVRMDIGGLPVTLLDTAGIRDSDDAIERLGIERAKSRADAADLRVFLVDKDAIPDIKVRPFDIVLRAKGDLLGDDVRSISGATGAGVSSLLESIASVFEDRISNVGIATHARHRTAIERSLVSLTAAARLVDQSDYHIDMAAEEIRTAVRSLDSLVGRIDVENLLDEIFLSFCIGK